MESRLRRLEQRLGTSEPERGQIAFVHLPSWPEAAREAFLSAERAGDTDTADRLVFEHTGVTPTHGRGYINMIITMPIGTVGEDLATVEPRYVNKEIRR